MTRMLNIRRLIMPSLNPTLSAMSSVSPLVLTSTATVAESRETSPPLRRRTRDDSGHYPADDARLPEPRGHRAQERRHDKNERDFTDDVRDNYIHGQPSVIPSRVIA